MSSNQKIWNSVESLHGWAKKENHTGWDPYDVLNSDIIKKLCMNSPLLEIVSTQLNKYSIFNLRPYLNVRKGIDVKGMSLFAQAFAKMYILTKDEIYKNDLLGSMLFLKNKSLQLHYNDDCWAGHYYNYRDADGSILSPEIPDIITTSNVMRAIADSYPILKRSDLKGMGISAYRFLHSHLFKETDNGYAYLKYNPLEANRIVINASAEGLNGICKLIPLFDDNSMKETARKLYLFLMDKQKPDGSWVYSEYSDGKVRNQIDFHQGFILDSLIEYLPFADNDQKDNVLHCIKKGAEFFRRTQFLNDGKSHFRYPQLYPIDIHNQAQGIITFSKLGFLNDEYLEFAKLITNWTIHNMQDNSGYFYYQKYKYFANKTPHMRWGQAWMMLALATLLEAT